MEITVGEIQETQLGFIAMVTAGSMRVPGRVSGKPRLFALVLPDGPSTSAQIEIDFETIPPFWIRLVNWVERKLARNGSYGQSGMGHRAIYVDAGLIFGTSSDGLNFDGPWTPAPSCLCRAIEEFMRRVIPCD